MSNPSPQTAAWYVEAMARFTCVEGPQEAANWKQLAQGINVSDDEMDAFKRKFYEGGEPPVPLAEMFGSDDAAKVVARMVLMATAEVERAQGRK